MRFWTIARKDLKTLRRDKSALIFTFGMPIILTFVFGSMYGGSSGGVTGLKVLVANMDAGSRGADEIQALKPRGFNACCRYGWAAGDRAEGFGKGDLCSWYHYSAGFFQ